VALPLPAGRWRVRLALDIGLPAGAAPTVPAGSVEARAGDAVVRADLADVASASARGTVLPLELSARTDGEPLRVQIQAAPGTGAAGKTLWLGGLSVDRP
jgi:hypothetical protein